LTTIDAISKLITILLRTIQNSQSVDLFEKLLESILIVLTKNHSLRKDFNPRPLFKLFFNILQDFKKPEYKYEAHEIVPFLNVFTRVLHKIQPCKYPSFAFCWVELISNNIFLKFLVPTDNKPIIKLQENYQILLSDLFRFFKDKLRG
jgi:hypothetical protein